MRAVRRPSGTAQRRRSDEKKRGRQAEKALPCSRCIRSRRTRPVLARRRCRHTAASAAGGLAPQQGAFFILLRPATVSKSPAHRQATGRRHGYPAKRRKWLSAGLCYGSMRPPPAKQRKKHLFGKAGHTVNRNASLVKGLRSHSQIGTALPQKAKKAAPPARNGGRSSLPAGKRNCPPDSKKSLPPNDMGSVLPDSGGSPPSNGRRDLPAGSRGSRPRAGGKVSARRHGKLAVGGDGDLAAGYGFGRFAP